MIETLTADQVAALLHRKRDWFYRHWPRLVREQQFPLPAYRSVPLVWCADHVQAWLDRHLSEEQRAAVTRLRRSPDGAQRNPGENIVALHRAHLERRYARG